MVRRLRLDNASLFGREAASPERFRPLGEFDGVPCLAIDIPDTIPALGYGSHQWFRYYGKFPSVLGREIISRFAAPGDAVLDNYIGSGTTAVEAQIQGHASFGIDVNPLGVFASNVKTRYYSIDALRQLYADVVARAMGLVAGPLPEGTTRAKFDKWFSTDAQNGLSRLRLALLGTAPSQERDFLTTCFLGVVRRCSNAYDGEVRPHINKSKRPQDPFVAFSRKFDDMIAGLQELDRMRERSIFSASIIGDNRNPGTYSHIPSDCVGLVVAHPPYLNSFNYLQVFSLEFSWAQDFCEIWDGWTLKEVQALEQRAWPATNKQLVENYYEGTVAALNAATSVLRLGGTLAVVVGDATIYKQLESVHTNLWRALNIGALRGTEIWYRTTHYGIGKYAYSDRADYHGEDEAKRDAILFFKKAAS